MQYKCNVKPANHYVTIPPEKQCNWSQVNGSVLWYDCSSGMDVNYNP